ncbi:hypothetical protein ACHAXH_006637 [Discostella pseudostelligera]
MARAESLSDALGVGNEVIFTHRLKLCQKWGLGDEAEQLLREMQEQNLKPSIIHFTAALNAWAKSVDDDALSRAEDLFERLDDGGQRTAISAVAAGHFLIATAYRLPPPTTTTAKILRLPLAAAAVSNSSTTTIMFKDMVNKQVLELKKLWANKRQLTFQLLNLAMIVFSALMIWKGLMFATRSESPVVVVLSGSMEPAFQRGDILFLNNSVEKVYVGDVVVFKIKDRDIPIVHRILKVHEKPDGHVELLTKGDNNRVDDRGLYAPGQLWLEREDILGKAVGTLRYVGMVTIALNDYPVLKYVLVGMMGLFVLTSKEG